MAIAFRTGSGATASSGFSTVTSQALVLGTTVTGDFVMVAVVCGVSAGAAVTISLSGGSVTWTQEGSQVYLGGSSGFGTGINVALFTATAVSGTSGATVTATMGTPGGETLMACVAYSGTSGVDIFPSPSLTTSSSGGTSQPEPSGTTNFANDWLVDVLGIFTVSTASPSITNPTDATTTRESTAAGGDFNAVVISDSNAGVAQGSVGGGTWSWTGNANGVGMLVALKPAATQVNTTLPGKAPSWTRQAVVLVNSAGPRGAGSSVS